MYQNRHTIPINSSCYMITFGTFLNSYLGKACDVETKKLTNKERHEHTKIQSDKQKNIFKMKRKKMSYRKTDRQENISKFCIMTKIIV